jgi:hypothetical protein
VEADFFMADYSIVVEAAILVKQINVSQYVPQGQLLQLL